jgi:hypothetical protein
MPDLSKIPNPYAIYRFNGNADDSSGNDRHIEDGVSPQYTQGSGIQQALLGDSYLGSTGLISPVIIDSSWNDFTFICQFYVDTYEPIGSVYHFNFLYEATKETGMGGIGDKEVWMCVNSNSYWGSWSIWHAGNELISAEQGELPFSLIPSKAWHIIAISYDCNKETFSVFLNGNLIACKTVVSPPASIKFPIGALRIGASAGAGVFVSIFDTRWFAGKIQNVAIFDYSLTDELLSAITNNSFRDI